MTNNTGTVDNATTSAPGTPLEQAETTAGTSLGVLSAQTLSRDEMRAKIFASKPATEIVEDFYGVRLELRQPSLAVALEARNQGENEAVFNMLLNYSFVPGTNEKVFEPSDVDMIRELPFGSAMTDLMSKVNKLLGIDDATVAELLKDATKST